ncbi:MAG: M4 family metallopeptidase [Phycicoccus sp.]|nr:M4 family metallopeptidase [Phycicoccus sp.]NMM33225.1 M4 family metallopeptidase [Phycicoccus sp.]
MYPKLISSALVTVVLTCGPALAAFGASSPVPPTPKKAAGIAAAQADSAAAGRALGLGAGEKLVVKDVITDPDGSTHVRYDRTFNGLRVIGGDLVSHQDKAGKVKSVSWNASLKVAVSSMTPRLSLASAKAAGAKKSASLQKTTTSSAGELVVFAGDSPKASPRLAYDVVTEGFRADQTPSRMHTIVDATTGATLRTWDEIQNGTGNGIYVGTVVIGTTPGSGYSMTDAVANYITDLNGATSGTGATFTDADDIWGNGTVSDRASAGVDAQYGSEKTFDYFKNVLGRNGIWNNGVGARSRVHFGNAYVNAFWDGTQMTYGDGVGNTHPLVELDVAGHEMSHGVTQATAGLAYSGDAGGLNEATSDIFGTAVEWYANNASDKPDYFIAELLNLRGNGTPLRYMDKPSKDGGSKDCWFSTLGSLDPHYSSGPLNHWFYLASEGSGAKVINGVSYYSPTCNASTVTGIGRDAAEKIWYRTLTTYLTSTSNYAAAREGAIKSAKDLYGTASTQCAGIVASFSAIGVPAGAETCETPFIPLNPTRVLDTRNGTGAARAKVGPGGQVTLTIPGLPAGTAAVALNVTATNPSAASYLTVYPAGQARPTASNLNFVTAQTIPNLVIVRVGAGNKVTFFNAAGTVDIIADLAGYYVFGAGAEYSAVSPTRVMDTRNGTGAARAKVGPGGQVTLTVPGLPAGTTAVVLNVTATNPSAASYLTVYPAGQARPTASNLNFVKAQTIPNLVIVRVGAGNKVTFFNAAGTVDIIADLAGYYAPGAGVGYSAVSPTRVMDTRTGTGAARAKVGPGGQVTLTIPGLPAGTTAVALNVTSTNPSAGSYLTVYPAGQGRPTASNLNFVTAQTIPNLVIARVGAGNKVTFFNAAGTVDVIADIAGYYAGSV